MASWLHLMDNAGRVTVQMGGNRVGKTLKAKQAQAAARAAGLRVVSLENATPNKSLDAASETE